MENLSHSRQPGRSVPTIPKKVCNGAGFGPGKSTTTYDDVFGGPPRFGAPALSPRLEDYGEIFGGFHVSRAYSIPVIDLPMVNEEEAFFDVRSQGFDYAEVFGSFGGLDFAPSYEELLIHQSEGGDADSSDEAWTPAETDSVSGGTDPSEKSQFLSNEDSNESIDGSTELSISCNKTGQSSNAEMPNGVAHVAELQTIPGYSFIVNDHTSVPKEYGNASRHVSRHGRRERGLKKTWSQPARRNIFDDDSGSWKRYSRKDSYSSEMFLTVSDVSLKTQPSDLPPPSRPPPLLAAKKRDSSSSASNCQTTPEGSAGATSPPYFDVELDASSAAAAMKEAMENAQVKLNSAKELMERKRDSNRSRKKPSSSEAKHGMRSDLVQGRHKFDEDNEWKEATQFFELVRNENAKSIVDDGNRGEVLLHGNEFNEYRQRVKAGFEKQGRKVENLVRNSVHSDTERKDYVGTSEATVEVQREKRYEKKIRAVNEVLEDHVQEKFRTAAQNVESEKELVSAGTSEQENLGDAQLKESKAFSEATEANKSLEDLRESEKFHLMEVSEKQEEDNFEWEEKARMLREALGQAKGEVMFKRNLEQEDVKKFEENLERLENERRLDEVRQRIKNEERMKKACEKEQRDMKMSETLIERRVKEACGKAENVDRATEVQKKAENESRVREALEKAESERKLDEVSQQIQNEWRLREVHDRKENERRERETFDRNNERRLKEAREEEENERREKEASRDAENKRVLQEAVEQEEREKRKMREAFEKAENETNEKEALEQKKEERRLREAFEQEEKERRLQEAFEQAENEQRQKEAFEQEEKEKRQKKENERKLNEALECEDNKRTLEEVCDRGEYEKKLEEAAVHVEEKIQTQDYDIEDNMNCHDVPQKRMQPENEFEQEDESRKLDKDQETEDALGQDQNRTSEEACAWKDLEKKLKDRDEWSGLDADGNKMTVEEAHLMNEQVHFGGSDDDAKCEEKKTEIRGDEKGTQSVGQENGGSEAVNGQRNANESNGASKSCPAAGGFEMKSGQKPEEKNFNQAQTASNHEENNGFVGARVSKDNVETRRETTSKTVPVKDTFKGSRKDRYVKPTLTPEERKKELEEERLRKMEEEREREREREKDHMAGLNAEALEMAERVAAERATTEARQRALAEARERLERACAEARERSTTEKSLMEARLRAERAAVERATAEARERAAEKAALVARERMDRSVSDKISASSRSSTIRSSSSASEPQDKQFQRSASFGASKQSSSASGAGVEGESPKRYISRLERHRRTAERVAKALAEKNIRDQIAQREQAERTRLAEALDADVKRWSSGKEGNIRALLSTLQYILGPESGWQPIPLTEVITSAAVRKAYRKATLCVHPDKLQQRGATIQQKYICEKIFDLLKVCNLIQSPSSS